MQHINRLGLQAAGLTAIGVLIVGTVYWGLHAVWVSHTTAQAIPKTASPTLDPTYGQVADQLQNLPPAQQSTVDSDGDGIPDSQEINQGQNPRVAGIQGENRPNLGSQVTDLSTYTNRYLSQLPENTDAKDIFTKDRLEAWVDLNKGELLPALPPNSFKTSTDKGKEAVRKYLDSISPDQNKNLQPVSNQDIEQAMAQQFQAKTDALQAIVDKLTKNVQILESVVVPAEVAPLHTKMLQASISLLNNTKLLQNVTPDFVGSLVGSKNIEDLAPVFQDIATQVSQLDQKYGF